MNSWLADKPVGTRHLFASVLTYGVRNRVLTQERAGLAAFETGANDAIAARAFDDALDHIESIYADNPAAEKARSTFVPERTKEFKGESYERAMAFYYRGLIYLGQGDYGNARAVFQGGQLQDAFAEDKRYQSDFATLDVLAGWASQCDGDMPLARSFYDRAQQSRPGIFIPHPGDRLLAIADIGTSPTKEGGGQYGEYLTYVPPTPVPEAGAIFMAGGLAYPASFGEDIYWQASTRGGRQVDKILAGKAQFKEGAAVTAAVSLQLADVALDVAANQAWYNRYDSDNDGDTALAIGLGLAAIGIGAAIMSDSAAPEADTRYWDNLPAHIDFTTLPPGAYPTEVRFTDKSGDVIGKQQAHVRIDPKGRCGLIYARSRSAADIPAEPPNVSLRR